MTNHTVIRMAAIAALGLVSGTVMGAPFDWTGLGAADTITTANNWEGLAAPGTGDVANFTAIAVAPPRAPAIATTSINGIAVDNSGGYVWTLPGSGTLTLGGGGISVVGGGVTGLGSTVTLGAAQNWTIGANTTVQMLGGSNINGSGKLTKLGQGTLLLTNESLHTGTIDIKGGVLANARQSGGTGGLSNTVSVYDGGTYETRVGLGTGGVSMQLYNGATIRGSGGTVGISSSSGNQLRVDTASGTSIKLATVLATDTLFLTEEFIGGSSNSVIEIVGPGFVALRASSGNSNTPATPFDATNTYVGGWKVTSGSLILDQFEGGLGGTTEGGITVGRPLELAGGSVRLALTANGSNASLAPSGRRSTISVTGSGEILVERQGGAGGATARTIGALVLGQNATLGVSAGRMASTATTDPFVVKLTADTLALSGSGTINVYNGQLANGAPYSMEMDVNAVSGPHGFTKTGSGSLYLTKAPNTYTGPTIVSGGTLRFVTGGAASTSAIRVASGATVRLGNGSATAITADLSGSGTISIPDNGTNKLTLQGSLIQPGSSAGILSFVTIGAPIELGLNGSELSTLQIEVLGGGAVAGVDYDRLALSHALNGIANANLVVDISGVTDADMAGDVLAIVTASNNFTGLSFASVTVNGGTANVNYLNGSITLSNIVVPEPSLIGLAGFAGLFGLRRRNRRLNQAN